MIWLRLAVIAGLVLAAIVWLVVLRRSWSTLDRVTRAIGMVVPAILAGEIVTLVLAHAAGAPASLRVLILLPPGVSAVVVLLLVLHRRPAPPTT